MSQPERIMTDHKPFRRGDGWKTGIRFDRESRSINKHKSVIQTKKVIDFRLNQSESLEYLERLFDIGNLINAVRIEHKQKNWDGYGAKPVNADSLNYADKFLRNLEASIPLPFVGGEPSGRVGIEWATDKTRFTVAFNPDGSITYAGINHEGRVFSGQNRKDLDDRIKNFELMSDATSLA